ncbi:MAG: hypothetical protein HY707_09210 [Ignavibacteriae bacterium]|nr:hypothetical protein [Ignavibacteriota bacterium]
MNDLEQTLIKFGLTDKEIILYLATLELGESLVQPLARHANLKRPTVYELLPRLEQLGLITYGSLGKRRSIIAEPPAKLIALQEEQLVELRQVMPQLASRFNVTGAKPKLYSYEGIDGIRQVYEDTLIDALPILSFLQVGDIHSEIRQYLLKSYVPRRVKRRIHVKNIVSGTEAEGESIVPEKGTFRENRYVNQKFFPANIEVLIYSNKVAYLTYKSQSPAMGIIVESGEIAETMRSFHKMAWEYANTVIKPKKSGNET